MIKIIFALLAISLMFIISACDTITDSDITSISKECIVLPGSELSKNCVD